MFRYLLMVFFLVGLAVPVHLSFILNPLLLAALFTLAICFHRNTAARIFCAITAGLVLSTLQLQSSIRQQMPVSLEGVDLVLDGHVRGLPQYHTDRQRFQFVVNRCRVRHLDGDGCDALHERRVRLSWRLDDRTIKLRTGQAWRLVVRLKRPRGFVNPGGFDYQAWLLGEGFSATGYVKPNAENVRMQESPDISIHGIRESLALHLFGARQSDISALSRALVIGDRSKISGDQWQVLNATGTTHLMAISGLHIGLVATLIFFLLRGALPVFVPNGPLWILRAVPVCASILASGFYAALAGFAIPTQRAWIIVLVANLAYLFGIKTNPFYLLLIAAIIVLLLSPWATLSSGFWLSFGAVALLIFGFAARSGRLSKMRGLVLAQWFVGIGLAVVLVVRQLPISLVGPLANIIAVPVVSILVVPLLFLAALCSFVSHSVALTMLSVAEFVLGLLWRFLELIATLDLTYWYLGPRGVGHMLLGVFGTVLLLMPRVLGVRLMGLCLCMMFFSAGSSSIDSAEVTVLDVGQGLSAVMTTDKHTVVYDVGARFSDSFDIGSRVVVPFLRYRARSAADLLIVSHGDNDHAGGLASVLESLVVRRLAFNEPPFSFSEGDACLQDMAWDFGELTMEVLWPTPSFLMMDEESNNRSCVVLLRRGHFTLLFTGDIEADVEQQLLASGRLPNRVDVLVAPHHGSATSSSLAFVTKLRPEQVIYSSGYKNPYGHPASDVVSRYEKVGSTQWNTAEHGALTIRIDKEGSYRIDAERLRGFKPWYAPNSSASLTNSTKQVSK